MDKVYNRIFWKNEAESQTTPLGASNLNKIDAALDTVDNRVITLDTTKAKESEVLSMLANVEYDSSAGVLTFTRKNGTQIVADFNVEKIPVEFSMSEDGIITMKTTDGSTFTADVGALIKDYSFEDSTTIAFNVVLDSEGNKTVMASIPDGSVTENKLQPNFLADCRTAKSGAEAAAGSAEESARLAGEYAAEAGRGAGGNALAYEDNVLSLKHDETVISSVTIETGSGDYSELENKPSINGVVLEGNKTTEDLLIEASSISSYDSIEEALADTSLEDGEYFSTNESDETEPSATILDTIEDIRNNTEENQIVGALAVKDIDSRLTSMTTQDKLWSGQSNNATITIEDMLNKYKILVFVVNFSPDGDGYMTEKIFHTEIMREFLNKVHAVYGYADRYLGFKFTNNSTLVLQGGNYNLRALYGIK